MQAYHVEGPRAIAPNNHILAREILHKKAKEVNLHRTPIVSSETMSR
jgi:hypothetical protein